MSKEKIAFCPLRGYKKSEGLFQHPQLVAACGTGFLVVPINVTAGVSGMNVGGIPMDDAEHVFATIVLLMSTGLLGYLSPEKCRN